MTEIAYQEISCIQESVESWKEVHLNAGAAQSTLQDIKLPETAGGYVYKESHIVGSPTSNRFIYWRSNDNILELIETSFDVNLTGCHLRLNFQNTPILEGVSVHETQNKVVILVATVSSVHRLIFPHPSFLGKYNMSFSAIGSTLPSIFCDVSPTSIRDKHNIHLLNHAGSGLPLPHTSTTWFESENMAAFALAYSTGALQVVCMAEMGVSTFEMKQTSVMTRLWNGIIPSSIRGTQEGDDVPLSLSVHFTGSDHLIFALCKDLRLRIWSCQKKECLLSTMVLEFCREFPSGNSWTLSGRHPCLRVASNKETGVLYLCVYINLPEGNQFCIFQTIVTSGQYQLIHMASICAPEHTLVDFSFSESQLWTLWLDGNSDPIILCRHLYYDSGHLTSSSWIGVALNSISRETALTIGNLEAREVYMQDIFSPGRFSATTITKAISIYCRATDVSFKDDIISRADALKDKVTAAVENEIRSKANESELTDDEFLELQVECWERFFSYCLQYHEVGTKALGLFSDPSSGIISLIRKNILSVLRPCDPLECLLLSDTENNVPEAWFRNVSLAGGIPFLDPVISHSLLAVLKSINLIRCHLTEDMTAIFDHELYHLQSPEYIASEIANELKLTSSNHPVSLLKELANELKNAPHLLQALEILLQSLDLSKWQGDEMNWAPDDIDVGTDMMFSRILSSNAGADILCKSLQQMVKLRYAFCRDLLLLENIIISIGEKSSLSFDQVEQLRSQVVSLTSTYTQGYFVIFWATQSNSIAIKPSILEKSLRELSLIKLPEPRPNISGRMDAFDKTIVQLFVGEYGGEVARKLLAFSNMKYDKMSAGLYDHLLTLRAIVAHFIWPISVNMLFPEFLLSQSQFLPLQEYIRLLKTWCEWNNCSRMFLMANTHLALGEPIKAVDLFCEASEGISQESFLRNKILQSPEMSSDSPLLQYYLKVIQLFSYFNLPDSIIRLASKAIEVANENDPNLVTFWSLIFKYHLDMDHSQEAYTALTRNPDSSRRKDCLRQFLVVMFERGHLKELMQFPFIDMQDDVVSILESKARSTDLTVHSYYEFLYAFHLKCSNFRRAASAMYEYGSRLSQEVIGLPGLSRQASCLLTTLNCLQLVNPKYSWIVKPVPNQGDMEDKFGAMGLSPKRDVEGEEIQKSTNRNIEVLEIKDIQKEYCLVHARLLLLKKDSSPTNMAGSLLSSTDTVTLLVAAGLYDAAILLSVAFELKFHSIFEGLAARCADVHCNKDTTVYFDLTKDEESNALTVEDRTNQELWLLLKTILNKYELPQQSIYHRTITEKFLAIGFHIPTWLKNSYKTRNCPELIRLFLKNDIIEEASELMKEYIDLILSQSRQITDVKKNRVWLPFSIVDCLLGILEEKKSKSPYNTIYIGLVEKLNTYFDAVLSIGNNLKNITCT